MAGKSTDVPDTMQAGLQALLPDIAVCKAAADADIPYLDKLEKVVLLRIHQPPQSPAQAGPGAGAPGATGPAGGSAAAGGPPPGMGLPGGPAGGGSPNQAMPGGAGPVAPTQPGGVSKPMTPDPDQMRRVLAEQAGA
jgi:hypothetical protein